MLGKQGLGGDGECCIFPPFLVAGKVACKNWGGSWEAMESQKLRLVTELATSAYTTAD